MKIELQPIIDRFKNLGGRFFEKPVAHDQLQPSQISPDCKIQTVPDSGEIVLPTPDLHSFASGYFEDLLRRSLTLGIPQEEVIKGLMGNPVLRGAKRRKIESVIADSSFPEAADALAGLMPPALSHDARRALMLWAKQKETSPEYSTQQKDVGNKPKDSKIMQTQEEPDKSVKNEPEKLNLGKLYQKPTNPQYGVRFGVKVMSEEEVANWISSHASKLAKKDARLVADCTKMIDTIRENPTPYGNPGIARMYQNCSMVIEETRCDLWRFNPDEVRGLRLSHPLSQKLRIVFCVYTPRENGEKLVVLDGDGIYHHDVFDKRYKC